MKSTNVREWNEPEIARGILDMVKMLTRIETLKEQGVVSTSVRSDTNKTGDTEMKSPKKKRGRPVGWRKKAAG